MNAFLSSDEYNRTINDKVFTEIMTFASLLVDRLIKNGKKGDKPVIEENGTRNVSVPKTFMGIKIGEKTSIEGYKRVTLCGWELFDKTDIMGQDKNEWYKWTWHLLLGEDGFLYARHQQYTEIQCTNYMNIHDEWLPASRLAAAHDIIKFEESATEGSAPIYYRPFGSYFWESLKKLGNSNGIVDSSEELTKSANYPDIVEGGIYRIKSKDSGLYLDAIGPADGYGNGNAVGIWEYTGRENQNWKVISGNEGYLKLMNMTNISDSNDSNGKVIDIDGGQNENGTTIHMWDNSYRNNNQDLKFVRAEDGSYTIKTGASGETKCLDVCGGQTISGALVHQWDSHYGPNQQWLFEPI